MLRNSRFVGLALLLVAACSNDAVTEPTPAPDLTLVVLSGGAQTGMTGRVLEQPLLV